MDDLRLFHCIDCFFIEIVYVIGTWDVFTDEGLTALYSCLPRARVRLEISGGGVGCGRYDGHGR